MVPQMLVTEAKKNYSKAPDRSRYKPGVSLGSLYIIDYHGCNYNGKPMGKDAFVTVYCKNCGMIEPEPERTCEILHDDNLSEQYGGPMARCSYCGAVLPEEFTGPYYYCPCCGSKNKVVCDAN